MVQVQVEGGQEGKPLLLESDSVVEEELSLEMSDTPAASWRWPSPDGCCQHVWYHPASTPRLQTGPAVVDNAGAGSSDNLPEGS